MSKDKSIVYFSYDADNAGRKVGQAVLHNDVDALDEVSKKIQSGNILIAKWAKDRDGVQYSSGGDQGVYSIPRQYVKELDSLRIDYNYLTGLTVSMGVGEHLSESGQALLMAKLKGKNRIVEFGNEVEREIKAIRKRSKKGVFRSMEEYKVADSYLEKAEPEMDECDYCKQSDGVDPDHCKYCHDEESKEGEEKCKFCSYDEPMATTHMDMPELAEQDCEFCNQKDTQEQEACPYCHAHPSGPGTSPDSNNDQAVAGSEEEKEMYHKMDMNPPIIGKPNPDEEPPIRQNPPMDVEPKGQKEDPELTDSREVEEKTPVDPEDNHSKEALMAIAQQIEDEGTPPEKEMNAIDDSDMPNGSQADGNVSRPDGYDQNTPQDMGIPGTNPPSDDESDNDEPDFADIFEEGLNQHSDGIRKEKAIRMVSEALMQFKASKDVLEQMKESAPQLYQASLSILKAMIEMAGLLDLTQQPMPEQSELGSAQQELMPEKEENEWHDPFPKHPDEGGERKPGHAPSSEKEGEKSPPPQP